MWGSGLYSGVQSSATLMMCLWCGEESRLTAMLRVGACGGNGALTVTVAVSTREKHVHRVAGGTFCPLDTLP